MMRTSKYSIRIRSTHLIDIAVISAVIGFIVYVVYRVDTVLVYNWYWGFIPDYILRWDEELGRYAPNLLLKGLFTTFRLAVWSLLLASLIGVIMGVMRTSKRLFPRMVSRLYVEFVRNMPPATLVFLEMALGPPELFSNVISGIICLAIFEAAYITEIVRAGIQSIDRGQIEAGQSIGLSQFQVLRWIVLPQAVQRMVPPLAGQFITLIKDSSLVSLISIQELTFLAQEVAYSTQYVFEIWIFVAVMYFCICYLLAWLFGRLEKRLSVYRA